MPKQNTSPADYPQAVLQQIALLGQHIAIARKRRGETQGQWAGKLGVSQPTMARIERGDPSVAMASYVMCMWLINQAHGLADLVAPLQDHAALEREVLKARKPKSRQQHAVPALAPGKAARSKAGSAAHSAASASKVSKPAPQAAEPRSTYDIQQRILASAAKGNATAAGLAALMLPPSKPKAG